MIEPAIKTLAEPLTKSSTKPLAELNIRRPTDPKVEHMVEQTTDTKVDVKVDLSGIALSSLCAIHCLATPVLAAFLPHVSRFVHHDGVHQIFLILVIPIALYAFVRSYSAHKSFRPLIFGLFGLVILTVAALSKNLWIERNEVLFSIIGSTVLLCAHILNLKLVGSHSDCRHTTKL